MSNQEETALLNRHQRRWKTAFISIFAIRVLVSLSKKDGDKNNGILLPSCSYVAIDIHNESPSDDHHKPFEEVELTEMGKEKSAELFPSDLEGVKQPAVTLENNPEEGSSGDEAGLAHRRIDIGANRHKQQPVQSFLSFVYEAFKDKTIIIFLVCAVISIGFDIKRDGWKDGWYDGGSIIVPVFLAVIISALCNFNQNRKLETLSDKSGLVRRVSHLTTDVGNVVCFKAGDQVPADRMFLDGHPLKLYESGTNGQSHLEVNQTNPFFHSGRKVKKGSGTMPVTSESSESMKRVWQEEMGSKTCDLDDEEAPFQARLNRLTFCIWKIGLAVAIVVVLVLLIRYFTGNTKDERGNREFKGSKTKFADIRNAIVHIVAAAVRIMVVAIPEGLPMFVTLTLAYSMKFIMADQALIRKLSVCGTMGSLTAICIHTLNEIKVTAFCLGNEVMKDVTTLDIAPNVHELLQEGVGLNTIDTIYKSNSASPPEIPSSPAEKAVLSWAVLDLGINLDKVKKNCQIIHVESSSSEKKRSGVLMRRMNENAIHIHWSGAAEIIVAMCSQYYVRNGTTKFMDDEERMQIATIINNMAAKSLRCVAFAHKIVAAELGEIPEMLEETGLNLLGIVGLTDPCPPGVRTAVETCRKARVDIKIITEQNMYDATAIAVECGILNPDVDLNGEAVVEAAQFRNLSHKDRLKKIENIQVIARCSPDDKLLIVQCLKQKGDVVAVIGDSLNDAPALKKADIGLSMGIQGTEIANKSSDMIILADNLNSVVNALITSGRYVYNNIQKFLEFQLTVNVAALVINFIAAVSTAEAPLIVVPSPLVKVIMDTVGVLTMVIEQPANDLMTKPPVGRSKRLINFVTWRNIISQGLYQAIAILTLQFKGQSIFGENKNVKKAMTLNTFVLCQIFNEFNASKLEKNILKGIHKNKLFLAITGITIVLPVVLVEYCFPKFANTEKLNMVQWAACIGIASLSWPIDLLFKFVIPVSV